MSTRIGLISDVHATPDPLQDALAIFAREGVEAILCAGDIAGYGPDLRQTVDLLAASGCRSILGNHDLWWLADFEVAEHGPVEDYLRQLPLVDEFCVAGQSIAMVHGSPPASVMEGIKLFDENGAMIVELQEEWSERLRGFSADVLVVGHTHQVFAEQLGDVLVINPGSTRFNHTCAILHLPELEVEFLPLGGKEPEMVWNWGMQYRV
jgi:putative phosphoesterase